MKHALQLLVHGRGNAWPVMLGERHPFYDRHDYRDLANAAFSLVARDDGILSGDILVDAGHGTIQSLLAGVNRIPDCICLTHGHMDHTLSVDWVVQSYWKLHQKERRYPLYATLPVYRFLIRSYPHLEEILEFRELVPGETVNLELGRRTSLTGYPVYHGQGAVGASMLFFESGAKRVLFTGDLFSPLLRKEDYKRLQGADLVVADCNNRFPWPRTNHWSFAGHPDDPMERSEPLCSFLGETDLHGLTGPHLGGGAGEATASYFERFTAEWDPQTQPFTLLEFLSRIDARRVVLVHYSGTEDQKHYGEPMLSAAQLRKWVAETASRAGAGASFIIPEPGEEIDI
jgi:glyoxylase-like metal-dependent hydrolase (beta-lactamase superfamily II)